MILENAEKPELTTVKIFQMTCPVNVRWAIQKYGTLLMERGAVVRYGRKLLVNPNLFMSWLASKEAK